MSFSKGNNLIYHPLNYMLFNLLYWMFSLSRLQWCLGLWIHVLTEMVGYNCFIIFQYYYLNIKILKFYENFENFYHFDFFWKFWNLMKFLIFFWNFWNFWKCWKFGLFFVYCMGVTKWEGDSKEIVTRWAICRSRMLPLSYPIKLQLTFMKYNKCYYYIVINISLFNPL